MVTRESRDAEGDVGKKSSVGRRRFLGGLGATTAVAAVAWVGGRGYYSPAIGAAYAPWTFTPTGGDPLLELVHAATLAANPHNTQPWLFRLEPGRISIHADLSRSLGVVDPFHREMRIGLGCALENLTIAARHRGFVPTVHYASGATVSSPVAQVDLTPGEAEPQPLFSVLTRRRTHRGPYINMPLTVQQQDNLSALASGEPAVRFHWFVTKAEKQAFGALTIDATKAFIEDVKVSEASFGWFRQSKKEIEAYRDGITLDAQALGGLTTFLGKILGKTSRETGDEYWLANTRDVHCREVSAFCFLSTPEPRDTASLLQIGRVYQRLHLVATTQGLNMQPLNQTVERRDQEIAGHLAPRIGDRIAALVGPGRHAQMPFRIGYGEGEVHHSPRRDPRDTILK